MTMIPTIPYLLPWDEFLSDRCLGGIASADALLLWTVLYDGLRQYCVHAHLPESHEFREGKEWLLSNDNDWPFSFINLCAYFGIEPQSLRDAMIRLRKNTQKEI